MSTIVYKVVFRRPSGLTSLFATDGWQIRYRQGIRTHPKLKRSRLFAFESEEAVRAFVRTSSSEREEIWLAEAEGVEKTGLLATTPYYWSLCWSSSRKKELPETLQGLLQAPAGTVLCRSIRLLQRVET